MKKIYFLFFICIILSGCKRCGEGEVITFGQIAKIHISTNQNVEILKQPVTLYLDHSTCVIDARQNSRVFNALRPQLGQYSDTICLIKGSVFEKEHLDHSDNQIFKILQTINKDIPNADILKALDEITSSDHQAVLITDCEFIKDGLCHDQDPYLSRPLKLWLKKGYVVYIITEPYYEKIKGQKIQKKRFYFIFTDDNLDAPISSNLLAELKPFEKDSLFHIQKLTNSDIQVFTSKNNVCDQLSFEFEKTPAFDFVTIYDAWDDIRKSIMNINKHYEPIYGGIPLPIFDKIVLNDGENYKIEQIQIVASNITALYNQTTFSNGQKEILIPDGFTIDSSALKNNEIKVFLTDKIFDYLNCEFDANLIKIDFVITQVSLKPINKSIFNWQSAFNKEEAICVFKSIENVLLDTEIVPTAPNRKVIHTIYLNTQSF